jgi:hypothetical protein
MVNNQNTENVKDEVKPVQIRPAQVPHFRRILEILSRDYGYLDVSPLGSGKTHLTYGVASAFKLNVMVICPVSAVSNWKRCAKMYGINLLGIMSYETLRGQSGKVSHNLLEVVGEEYRSTEVFDQCVKSGLLLVFDEYHRVKNENTQLASAHALVKGLVRLVRMGYKARVALLSGTPCEQKESVTSTFKMLGIILSDQLYEYNRSSKVYNLIGIQEAISKCNEYDPNETLSIACRTINRTTAKTICYDLYTRVLKRFAVSSMPPPENMPEKDAKNYYIIMPPKDVERMKDGVLLFKSATNFNEITKETNVKGNNWGDVTKSRREIDSAKIPSVCRIAEEQLLKDPNCKVLIYCNYTDDIHYASAKLAKYNPVVIYGKINKTAERDRLINLFQEDNNNHRVVVTNPKVGGMAIELDDKVGTHPRHTYILPSYFFSDQHQVTGRTWRDGTKSKSTIRFIYSRAFPYESGILDSMAKKSNVVRNMVTEEHEKLIFPGEYEELLELTPDEIEANKKAKEIEDAKIKENTPVIV